MALVARLRLIITMVMTLRCMRIGTQTVGGRTQHQTVATVVAVHIAGCEEHRLKA
ncbi:hypothetical protein EDC22_104166 [Tepidamorphus gemmatus]|uniref:Uncharacterized protein n=1 Tax=Tepidamorphus gemmatus TaxID=747076 RepID=A0A4R3MGF9_9HYPH|nr:hypothetical protein EDC22_104166 [Tepidamorphus gemmatus]